ncbi:MAG: Kelch repeat-containing protein, partial [Acidobacteriota bacterium]
MRKLVPWGCNLALIVFMTVLLAVPWAVSAASPDSGAVKAEACTGAAPEGPGRDANGVVSVNSLSGSAVIFSPGGSGAECFLASGSQTLCFQADSFTTDWEYVYTLWLRFPAGWTVTNVAVSGTPSCNSGSWGTFSWSLFNGTTNEVQINHSRYQASTDSCTATYCVTVTPGGTPIAGDAQVSWYWDGDEYGGPPHWPCSSDLYTPAGMPACDQWTNPPSSVPPCTGVVLGAAATAQAGCIGSPVVYNLTLANYTGADATFDLSYTGNTWPVAGPATVGPVADGASADFSVTHNVPASALPGQIDPVTVTATDQANPATFDSLALSTTAVDVLVGEGPPSPGVHMDNVVAAYGGRLFNVAGHGSGGAVDIYDPATGSWSSGTPEPAPQIDYAVDGATGLDAGGDAVVVLFPDAESGVTTLHVYNMVTDTWTTPPLPAGFPPGGIWAPDIVCDPVSNLCYITGGATVPGGGNLNTAYVYNVAANTLTPLPPFTTPRDFHASFLYNGRLCIAGGVDAGSNVFSSTQCYDFGLGSWGAENADMAALPFGVWGMGDGVLDVAGTPTPIMAGGVDASFGIVLPDVLTYDGSAWNVVASFPHAVYRVEGETVGDRFYLAGGSTGGFTPSNYLQYYGVCPAGCPTITIDPAVLPPMQRGTPWSVTFTASGGTAPYSFSLTGTVPPGLIWDQVSAT